MVDQQSPTVCGSQVAWVVGGPGTDACADRSERGRAETVRFGASALHRGDAEDRSTGLAVFQPAGTVVSTDLHRLDRVGQTRRDEEKTSPRSTQPIGVWREARFEMMFGPTTQLYLTSTSPDAIHGATCQHQVAIRRRHHVAHDAPPDGINHVRNSSVSVSNARACRL